MGNLLPSSLKQHEKPEIEVEREATYTIDEKKVVEDVLKKKITFEIQVDSQNKVIVLNKEKIFLNTLLSDCNLNYNSQLNYIIQCFKFTSITNQMSIDIPLQLYIYYTNGKADGEQPHIINIPSLLDLENIEQYLYKNPYYHNPNSRHELLNKLNPNRLKNIIAMKDDLLNVNNQDFLRIEKKNDSKSEDCMLLVNSALYKFFKLQRKDFSKFMLSNKSDIQINIKIEPHANPEYVICDTITITSYLAYLNQIMFEKTEYINCETSYLRIKPDWNYKHSHYNQDVAKKYDKPSQNNENNQMLLLCLTCHIETLKVSKIFNNDKFDLAREETVSDLIKNEFNVFKKNILSLQTIQSEEINKKIAKLVETEDKNKVKITKVIVNKNMDSNENKIPPVESKVEIESTGTITIVDNKKKDSQSIEEEEKK